MRVWIDCEFNGFQGELISMALVAEPDSGWSGFDEWWYAVLPCERPGAWVREHVLPVLGREPVSKDQARQGLAAWLAQFPFVHLIADWPEDIKHFCELLILGPGQRINTPPLTMEIRHDLGAASKVPHNALSDAMAIRARHLEIEAA